MKIMKETHIMLDIETLSAETNAVVPSIGAARFDIETGDIQEAYQWNLSDLEVQQAKGRAISVNTVKWWLKQPQDAIKKTFQSEKTYSTQRALEDFTAFCRVDATSSKKIYIWGNGNMFDNAIIRSLCKDFGVEYPCDYKNDMDLRTAKFLFRHKKFEQLGKSGTAHNAIDDAINQAVHLHRMITA